MSSPSICPRIDKRKNVNGEMGTPNNIIDTLSFIIIWLTIYGSKDFYILLDNKPYN